MDPDHQKVSAVVDWPAPTCLSYLRSFLGLVAYYRRYIHQYAEIAAPLHHLTQKNVPFEWDDCCQMAFDSLKEKLCQAPILSYPQFGPSAAPFYLHTNASATGVGAVLEQEGHVIAYASRSLTHLRKTSVIQRECLAVMYGTKQFRHYLLGRPFTLYRPCTPAVALCPENGKSFGTMGFGPSRI